MLGKKLKVTYRTNFCQDSIKEILNSADFSLEGGTIGGGFEPCIKDNKSPERYVGKLSDKETSEGKVDIVCFSFIGSRLEKFIEQYGV